MVAGAKRELQEAVGDLEESDAELVLSLVHYLRSREEGPTLPLERGEQPSLERWSRALVLLLTLEDASRVDELGSILDQLEAGRRGDWASLSESVLARDWDRPEEDEAWADL